MPTKYGASAQTQDIQVTVGKDLSTVTIGDSRVEVSPDSNVVVYANEVHTKPAAASGVISAHENPQITIGKDFKSVALAWGHYLVTAEKAGDGSLIVSTNGTVKVKPGPANDTAAKAAHEIGAIDSAGEHKGEIYGGIYPADSKPIWFLVAPKSMNHFNAAAWAKEQGGLLPTRKQGGYLTTLKGNGGALTEIFNRGNSFPAGYVWLAEPFTFYRLNAWCQRLSDGDRFLNHRYDELPVLSVIR